jgi:NAD(P)-dependent dehydrogenase (short-subunit alcohol dehydrogenase family)
VRLTIVDDWRTGVETGLRGLRALITGGTTGIGLGIATGLASEGVDLVLVSLSPDEDSVASLRSIGVRAQYLRADVSTEHGVVQMVNQAWEVFDGIDLFINNAAGTWHEAVTKLTAKAWEITLATNLSACAYACREIGKRFIEQRRGSILIVGSTAAHVPLYREVAYRTSKSGLKALMEVVAIELIPYGIRVNMITPGAFTTDLTRHLPVRQTGGSFVPLRRAGEVGELAGSAVLLLSDRLSSYTVGAELVVDGGVTLRPLELFTDAEIAAMNMAVIPTISGGTVKYD